MRILLYPAVWDQFLCAVFHAYSDRSLCLRRADDGFAVSMFDTAELVFDEVLARRTEQGMRKLDRGLPDTLYRAWLSETDSIEDDIVAVMRHGYAIKRNPMGDLQNPSVMRVVKAVRFCGNEAHRMLQFIRFVKTPEGVYIADITPDCQVLTLIAEHFHGRFGDQALMIRDLKRGQAILSSGNGWHIASLGAPPYPPLPEDGQFEALWRGYFKIIANPARRNLKLQQQFVPLKYRGHMTEFLEK